MLPEEAGQFDREWRAAMARSAEALDLTEVYRILDRWRDIAAPTQADPEAHRRMLQCYSDMDSVVDDQLWTPETLEGDKGLFSWGPPPPPSFPRPDDLAELMTGVHLPG
ncbi:DUF6247 family protein [Pseudonocardia kujensis]|nr:DUF6247 family protein [Pseudonocardia kujensis]